MLPTLGSRYLEPWTARQDSPCSVQAFGGDVHWVRAGDACAIVKGTGERLSVWCSRCAELLCDARVEEMYPKLRRLPRAEGRSAARRGAAQREELAPGWEQTEQRALPASAGNVAEVPPPVSRSAGRRARTLPVIEVDSRWLELPGPSALARILIAEGRGDDEVLSATKTVFGARTDGAPHLFTRTDLARLRARIAKKGTA